MNTYVKTDIQVAPGARIEVRNEEWLVRRADTTSTGGQQLTCVGISPLVKEKETIFLTEIEDLKLLEPEKTQLVADGSGSYRRSLLYMEGLLRQTAPTDECLYTGHKAAMDPVPYQLEPALKALRQPRQRILIADGVGLGKTLEAGILVSELIKRGKGKRILVVAVKSMLTQFQKEFWCRFTIPLTRLDSVGIQRIRNRIPANHNPFYYYDKSIISIDTLKQDAEYRVHIERAYWDIIIIDEAHNVADRGTGALRNKLAQLLARRSDTLIMLSATPHDGKARSFASLMNMLDPTAVANPEDYGKEDIKGLFIRRFKKDIQDQVTGAFRQRSISVAKGKASPLEEEVFDLFSRLKLTALDQGKRRHGGVLFKTTLEKALFSSPGACIETIGHRLRRLEKEDAPDTLEDRNKLEHLKETLETLPMEAFSKYRRLLDIIRDPEQGFGWKGKDPADRLVIFAERLETLRFLRENLLRDLKLKEKQVAFLSGEMPDTEQQAVVEAFGKEEAPVRLLLASDVASEGINLHFLSHRMIHFDIPWSLMVFQQRNGRIDRYGQAKDPEIVYLVTESQNEKINGDTRILEVLIQKDEQAAKNIGDPSVFMKVCDIVEEERITAGAMESGRGAEDFEKELDEAVEAEDLWSLIMADTEPEEAPKAEAAPTCETLSLFPDNYTYLKWGLQFYTQSEPLQVEFDDVARRIHITANSELKRRLSRLPREVFGENNVFSLAEDTAVIQKEIARARKEEHAWPGVHLLWEQNPLVQWIGDKITAAFTRREAPVLFLQEALEPGETCFIISALIPNRKSHPLLHYWAAVSFIHDGYGGITTFEELVERTGLGKRIFSNPGNRPVRPGLKALLPEAVLKVKEWMGQKRREFEERINEKLNLQRSELKRLRKNQYAQLELDFGDSKMPDSLTAKKKEEKKRKIKALFCEYMKWVKDTMTTENNPYIQIIAVLEGKEE